MELWEILVPTQFQDNKKVIRKKHHRIWDAYVRKISGGLTIFTPSKGQWLETNSGELIEERVIPVRIACSEPDIIKIINYTIKHYRQLAVLAYKISDKVLLIHGTGS